MMPIFEQGPVSAVAFATRLLAILLAGAGLGTLLPPVAAPVCFIAAVVLVLGPWAR